MGHYRDPLLRILGYLRILISKPSIKESAPPASSAERPQPPKCSHAGLVAAVNEFRLKMSAVWKSPDADELYLGHQDQVGVSD